MTRFWAQTTLPSPRSLPWNYSSGSNEPTRAHKQARSVRVEAILASLPIEDYTTAVAGIHARLAVQAMSAGKQRSTYDIMIAATAAATNRILLTTDAKAEFNQLAGVRSEVISIQ